MVTPLTKLGNAEGKKMTEITNLLSLSENMLAASYT